MRQSSSSGLSWLPMWCSPSSLSQGASHVKAWFERVRAGLNKHRRLWLGAAWPLGIPITMPLDGIMNHMAVAGGTKSGKSAFLMRQQAQLAQYPVHIHIVNQKDD